MSEKPFDPTKPARTRDGRSVRILCTDAKGDFSIVALIDDETGGEIVRLYDSQGRPASAEAGLYLINAPDRCARWTALFGGPGPLCVSGTYNSRQEIENRHGNKFCALIEIIIEDGRPVDVHLHHVDGAQP